MNTENIGFFREVSENELELMLSWRNAPTVRANMYTRHEISLDEHLSWWGNVKERQDQKYFMYVFQSEPAGIVGFNNIDSINKNSSWAFYSSPAAPKGTGSRMEFLALEYAFNSMKLNKLCCEVLAFNMPVIKLHEKFGFKVEGVFREQHMVDGVYVDVVRLGILAPEWHAKRAALLEKITSPFKG